MHELSGSGLRDFEIEQDWGEDVNSDEEVVEIRDTENVLGPRTEAMAEENDHERGKKAQTPIRIQDEEKKAGKENCVEEPHTLTTESEEKEQSNTEIFIYDDIQYVIQSQADHNDIEDIERQSENNIPVILNQNVAYSYEKRLHSDNGQHYGTKESEEMVKAKQGPTFLIGSSRMGNLVKNMKVNNLKRKCIAKYKGGSKIEWARLTASELQPNVNTVFQTGMNNILNTRQTNNNIVHQFRVLTREGVANGHNVVVTSILPTDIGGSRVAKRVDEINRSLRRVVAEEGGTFLDMTDFFMKNGRIIESLYKREHQGYLHLNEKGASVMTHKINQTIIELGGREIVEDFPFPSLKHQQ